LNEALKHANQPNWAEDMRHFLNIMQRSTSDDLLCLCSADFDAASMLQVENSVVGEDS